MSIFRRRLTRSGLRYKPHDAFVNFYLTFCALCLGTLAHQDVQHKVFDEIRLSPNMDDLQTLLYLEAAMKESLRLFPLVYTFARQSDKSFTIGKIRNILNKFTNII